MARTEAKGRIRIAIENGRRNTAGEGTNSAGKAGRPKVEIPLEERLAIRHARERFKVGACYIVPVLKRFYGIETNQMRVYRVMKEEGLLYSKARYRVRRSWVRWERERSNELWHVDWHEMKDSKWRGCGSSCTRTTPPGG